ncbi:MAG: N-(5'-phosphoribosyl)anthranilate isomerase [Terriglobia bacterium]
MATRIKICGITRPEDAQFAIELGAAALGFNFYPPSPRFIEPRRAAEIIRRLPPLVTSVGVFADENDDGHVAGVAREAGVNAIQLHGPRLPARNGVLAAFSLILAVAVGENFQAAELGRMKASAFLLDTVDRNLLGGTGRTFDWSLARAARNYGNIILAGGLTPENVEKAIREVRPFAVDVASGVESAPGIKDATKLRAFFAAVRQTDSSDDLAIG